MAFRVAAAGLAAAAAVVACVSVPAVAARHRPPVAAPVGGTSHSWIENAWTTHLLDGSYPVNAGYFYDRAASYGTGGDPAADPVRDGFATTPVLRYTSYAQFSADLANGVIPDATWPAGSWVEYDNEQWAATPVAEQQDPEQAMLDFGTAAHNAGFHVFMTPARDLGNVDTTCAKQPGEDNNGWYNRCDIPGYAVMDGDGLVVQDQANTLTPALYQSFFTTAQASAVAVNPSAWVDSELSDGYGTPAQAYTAGSGLDPATCGGFFIHVANSDLGWENTLLSSLGAAGW